MRADVRYVLFASLTFSLASFAGSMGKSSDYKQWSIPIQGGFFVASQGAIQHIGIDGLIGNQYTIANNSQINGLAGIGLYINGLPKKYFQLSYGINAFYLGQTAAKGNIIQEDLFTNLVYQYDIQNVPIYANVKTLIYTNSPTFAVTLDAGIGPNFMWTSGYRETPLADFIIPDNGFTGTFTTTFSATAGIGLRISDIFAQFPFECGYRFFYLGKGYLKKNNDQYLNTLNTGDTYANALVCSVSI